METGNTFFFFFFLQSPLSSSSFYWSFEDSIVSPVPRQVLRTTGLDGSSILVNIFFSLSPQMPSLRSHPLPDELAHNLPKHLCLPGGPHGCRPLPISPHCSLDFPQPKRDGNLMISKLPPSLRRGKCRLIGVRGWQALPGSAKGQQIGEEKPKEASGRGDSCQFPEEQMAQQGCSELPRTQAPRTH